MALIRINQSGENTIGAVSFERTAVYNEKGRAVGAEIKGVMTIHDYIEDVFHIETERYILNNVHVYKETFGTNEFMILYHFIAEDLIVKEDHVHDDIKWLMEEEIIKEETTNKEWFHAYLANEAIEEADKLALEYEARREEKDED